MIDKDSEMHFNPRETNRPWLLFRNSDVFKAEHQLREKFAEIKKNLQIPVLAGSDEFYSALLSNGLSCFISEHQGKTVYLKVEQAGGGYVVKSVTYAHANHFTVSIGSYPPNIIYFGQPIPLAAWDAVIKQVTERLLRDEA